MDNNEINSAVKIGVTNSQSKGYSKLLEKLIKPYKAIQGGFAKKATSDKIKARKNGYKKYANKIMEFIFDYDPNDSINGITKGDFENSKDGKVKIENHHKVPVRDASINPESTGDLDNIAPVFPEDHKQADVNNKLNNGKKVEGVGEHAKKKIRKEKVKYCLFTFFDVIVNSFIVGFLYEFIYGFINRKIFEREKIDKKFVKKNTINAIKTALLMLLFAFPFGLLSVILMASGVAEKTINTVQICIAIPIILFGWYISISNAYYYTGDKRKAISVLVSTICKTIAAFILFYFGEIIELWVDNVVLQYILSDIYLVIIMIVMRLVADLVNSKKKAPKKEQLLLS